MSLSVFLSAPWTLHIFCCSADSSPALLGEMCVHLVCSCIPGVGEEVARCVWVASEVQEGVELH